MKRAIASIGLTAAVMVFWLGKPVPSRTAASAGRISPAEVAVPTARRPLAAMVAPKSGEPRVCESYLQSILSLDLERLGYEGVRKVPSRDRLMGFAQLFREQALGRGCGTLSQSHPLFYINQDFSTVCGAIPEISSSNEKAALGIVADCVNKLYVFRLQALAETYSQVPASEISDPKLLGLILLGTPGLSPQSWVGRYVELAKRRRDLSPSDPLAVADVARGAFAKVLTNAGEESAAEMTSATDELERLEPGDVRVLENRMLLARTQMDFETMKALALETLEAGENADEARFYLAQSHFLSGDKPTALKEVRALIQRDPLQLRWVRALEGMQQAPAGTSPEMIFADRNSSFGFDDQDPFAALE